MAEIAVAMDDRQRRIGEHAAQERPLWAIHALGQVPNGTEARAEWEAKAARLGAYREMFGWDHPGEAIGPEPAPTFPEARAEWHAAFAVMAPIEGIDVRNLTDGQLFARRRAYEAETSWAPKHVAEELRAFEVCAPAFMAGRTRPRPGMTVTGGSQRTLANSGE